MNILTSRQTDGHSVRFPVRIGEPDERSAPEHPEETREERTGSTAVRNSNVPTAQLANKGVKLK